MAAPPRPDARLFDLSWPGWRALPAADGLVTCVPDRSASTAWADCVLAQHHDGFVLWTACGHRPHSALPDVTHRPGVRGVALAPAGGHPPHIQAALGLAHRLTSEVTDDGPVQGRVQVRVVSTDTPDTADGLVRVPHLVTLRAHTGVTTEAVMWELLAAEAAQRWLGVPAPALRHIEAYDAHLLAQRTATRTRLVPASLPPPMAGWLRAQSTPLSIETACHHPDVVLDHLARQDDSRA